jgi:hypothetical protein
MVWEGVKKYTLVGLCKADREAVISHGQMIGYDRLGYVKP